MIKVTESAQKLFEAIIDKNKRLKALAEALGWETLGANLLQQRSAVSKTEEQRLYDIFVANANKKKEAQEQKDVVNFNKQQQGIPLTDEDRMSVNKFTIDDINALNIDWNVLFVSSKKGIGKTWTIKRLMHECDKEERHMIYIRQSKLAVDSNIKTELNNDDSWPFKVEGTAPMKMVSKNCFENDKNAERGSLGYLSGASSMYGQSYKLVKWIVFDECMSHKANDISPEDMKEWQKMLSSIIRDKRDCKIVMFGNFLERKDDALDQPFMQEYGISAKDNLKIMEVTHKGQTCRLLYINCRDLYEGIESQPEILLSTNTEFKNQLLSNSLEPESPCVITEDTYLGMHQELNLVYFDMDRNGEQKRRALEIRFMPQEITQSDGYYSRKVTVKHIACRISKFMPDVHNRYAYTNSPVISGSFDYIRLVSDNNFARKWRWLKMYLFKHNLLYGDAFTYVNLDKALKKFIIPVENSGFFN